MFRRILCPLDFDPNSFNALDIACRLARQDEAIPYVLHVVPLSVPAVGQPLLIEPIEGAEREAREAPCPVLTTRLAPK